MMKKEGLIVILEQNLGKIKEYLEKQTQSPEVQTVLTQFNVSLTESQKCITCSDRIQSGRFYALKNKDGSSTSDGLSFKDIYMSKNKKLINLEDELKKIIKNDILFDVDTTKEPLDSLSDEEKDNYKPLTQTEEETLEYICYVKATLLNYAKNENSNDPKTAIKYWKQICDKFKPKYEKDESEDESVIDTTPTGDKIYGCFDSTSESYWCDQPGNECPEGLVDSDFDNVSNRVTIENITYIHTGCSYTKTIILDNTYVFENPSKTFEAGTHTIKYKRPNTFKRISEKIDGMSLLGEYPPITNVKGFYGNEFTGELREDLNKALILMLSRHCMRKSSIPSRLTIYEGNTETTPLGQIYIKGTGDGVNCLDNLKSMRVYDDGKILKIRLKQLMLDELDQESGSQHRISKEDIEQFNRYIDKVFQDYGVEDDIMVDRNGKLQLESTMGLSKILENKPIGLEKILK